MSTSTNKPTVLFWVIAVLSFIWNAMGVNQYIQQAYKTESFKAMYSAEQLEIINNLPVWYTALFAIAVFAATLGSLFMLFKNKIANLLFKLSLIAVLIQTIYNLFLNEGKEFYGAFEYSMLISIPVIAFFLVVYTKRCIQKGWLS